MTDDPIGASITVREDLFPDRLITLIGRAVVEWSKIEALWSHIFIGLLYEGIGQQPLELPADFLERQERARAVYFSHSSAAAQRRMVIALSEVALKDRSEVFAALKALANRTNELSGWRNGIVHSFYDRPMSIEGHVVTWGDIQMEEHGRHTRFVAIDPLETIPKLIEEFEAHSAELTAEYLVIFNISEQLRAAMEM